MSEFQKNLVVWKLIFKIPLPLFRKSVSEELSSVETVRTDSNFPNTFKEFQKNLVVWKLEIR